MEIYIKFNDGTGDSVFQDLDKKFDAATIKTLAVSPTG